VIADTQTRVFVASKMTKGYFGVYPTTSCTTVFIILKQEFFLLAK
jgi:hypothetical protein